MEDELKEQQENKEVKSTQIEQSVVDLNENGLGRDVKNRIHLDQKSTILAKDYHAFAMLCGRFTVIAIGLVVAGFALKFIWTGLLPVLLALLVATVMVPVANFMRNKFNFPPALAAAATIISFFVVFGGIISAMVAVVSAQGNDLVTQAQAGLHELANLAHNLPFDIQSEQIEKVSTEVTTMVKHQSSHIATGVLSGFSTVSEIIINTVIMLFLSFFFTKDGDRFLPWLRKFTGAPLGWHLTEVFSRIWKTLSGYIQAQATVALVDAVLIGLGLWGLQVPLALVIGAVTFFASFIPLVGAIVAGVLAVVIALVSHGVTTALLALGLVVIVQQVEGHVLQPMLQSKAMGLHATVVLLSVTVGSALAGIVGAFLSVPVAATLAVILRYHAQVTALRAGEITPEEAEIVTVGPEEADTPAGKVRELYRELAESESSPSCA